MESTLKLSGKTKKRLPLYLFLLILSLYLGFLSRMYSFDGILFAIWTELGIKYTMFHPHHFLYCPLGFVILKLFRLFGYYTEGGYGAHLIFQGLTAIFGALGILLFLILMKRVTKDFKIAFLSSLLLAFSYGYWDFSIHILGVIPSCFFLIAALIFLQKSMTEHSASNYILMGLMHGIAILFYVSAVLVLPAILVALALSRKERRTKAKAILFYLLSSLLVVSITYLAVTFFVLNFSSLKEVFHWFFMKLKPSFAPFGYIINRWSFRPSNLLFSLATLRNTIFGNYFVINRDKLAPLTYQFLFFLSLIIKALYLSALLYFVLYFKRLWRRHATLIAMSLIWILSYALFYTFYAPGETKSWTPTLIPISILMGITFLDLSERRIKKFPIRGNIIALVTVSLLFVTNFFGTILPQSEGKNNIDLQKALFIRENTELGDLIILAGGGRGYNIGRVYIPYFSARSKLPLNQAIDRRLKNPFANVRYRIHLEREGGHKVFILSEILENSEAIKTIVKNHNLRPGDIITFFSNYKMEYIASYNEEFRLYEIIK